MTKEKIYKDAAVQRIMKRTLCAILLGLTIGVGCYPENTIDAQYINEQHKQKNTKEQKQDNETKTIKGVIKNIDEDSFYMVEKFHGSSANFTFENFRVSGHIVGKGYILVAKKYKLIYPGPSNYQKFDNVILTYKILSEPISYEELAKKYFTGRVHHIQKGEIRADGIIIDIKQIQ